MYEHKKTAGDNKEKDAASPTVATESVFITTSVDSHEGRDVTTFGTPEAYLHRETDEELIMLLGRALVDIMVKVASKIYQKYVIMSSKGKPILYVQMKRSCMAYYAVRYFSTGSWRRTLMHMGFR